MKFSLRNLFAFTMVVVAMCVMTVGVATTPVQAATIVKDGVSTAPIIVYADAPPRTAQVAVELADYIEKISGARPEVITGEPSTMPASAIWVGVQPAVKKLFPSIDFEFKHPEEIILAATDKHVVIAGRDIWDPSNPIAGRRGRTFENVQIEYGTINATYTFLQDQLNVRWVWPGELGEDIVPSKTITIDPFTYRFHPPMRARTGLLHYSGLLGGGYGTSHDWTRLQRLSMDSLFMPAGHAFTDWVERYKDIHPEIFALQPDGTRGTFPVSDKHMKLCQSNPLVWDLWLKDVEAQLAESPNQTVFNGTPNDGYNSGVCICEKCRAWDHPKGEPRRLNWRGIAQQYVAMSDRYTTFANHLAAKLKERFPDKDYYVVMAAYGPSRPVPVEAVPADNVIVLSVGNFLLRPDLVDRDSVPGTTHREQFIAWAKVAKHVVWRPNTGSPLGWQQGLPDMAIEQTIKDFKVFSDNGMGIFIDATWEHWATQGPMYYLMGQLTWDPSKDGHAIMKDYYQRAFGPAAREMEAYWNLFDHRRQTVYNQQGLEIKEFTSYYTPEFMAEVRAQLDKADAAAANGPEKYRKRIAFVRMGLDWTNEVLALIPLIQIYNKTKDKDSQEYKQIMAHWEKMDQIANDKEFEFAISRLPVRAITPRMAALNPDPLPKKKK